MNTFLQSKIKKACAASDMVEHEMIQSLWSGYGKILRYKLIGSELNSVVLKHVKYPNRAMHLRGWDTDLSHQRKIKSYKIETAWYSQWSKYCDNSCKIPDCLALEEQGDEVLIVLEDLDASGYSSRSTNASTKQMHLVLKWLANFHATYMQKTPDNLWPIGTYWHLNTRPDELNELTDIELKNAAKAIDAKLNNAKFKTFVHGDAKLANFCFSPKNDKVAAVDFQYVGGGCGMKDLAYFIGSCLYEDECEKREDELLDYYFSALNRAIQQKQIDVDAAAIETEWRELYPFAWADFHRFLKGWSPGHWKINSYSEKMVQKVINLL